LGILSSLKFLSPGYHPALAVLPTEVRLTRPRPIEFRTIIEPRIDFPGECLDPEYRFLVFKKPGVAHEKQVAETADMVVKFLYLFRHHPPS
jgi:hypothetical protein